MTPPARSRATTQSLATLAVVAATLVVVAATWVFVGGVGGQMAKPAATATVGVETANLDDGVARNDAVTLVHEQGEAIERGTLRVTVGDDVVFVRDLSGNESRGVVADVDGDGWADLVDPKLAADRGRRVDEWNESVTVGDRLVIRERDDARSVDVIEPGETLRVVCVTAEGREVVVVETTV